MSDDTPGFRDRLDDWWTSFRSLPWWAQTLAWIAGWPLLAGLFFARWPRLGPAAIPVGVVFALLFTPAWVGAVTGGEPDEDPTEVAVADPTPTPTPPPSPTPEPEPELTPTPDPTPDDEPEETAVTTTDVDGDLEVHFIDVGQADATLLKTDDLAVLVDAGHWQRSDVVPYLESEGVETLDLIIITHPHADHIGQFDQVMDAFDVTEVWWSGATHTTQTFQRAVTALEASDAAYEEPRAGDTTTVGPLLFEVVNPPPTANFSDLHDSNLAFRVTYGDVRFLFTGDAEASTERRMVSQHRDWLDAGIYQAGHHGSSTSTTAGFLDAASPSVAVYSAGEGNQYGHPHDEVIDRLDAAGIDTYGTDVHGTVIVTTDGTGWSVDTVRDGVVAAPRGPPDDEPDEPDETADDDPPAADTDGCGSGQVDINSAGEQELQEIIHIGPARAEEMIEIRPFRSVDDMTRITGIGPARLEDIKEQGVACVA